MLDGYLFFGTCIILLWLICCIPCYIIYLIANILSLVCLHRKTLVIFDSRGRHVLVDDPTIVSCVYPGITLQTVGPKIEAAISCHTPISCLVMVGVNNLTIRDSFNRTVQVAAEDPFVLANLLIDRILALRARIKSFWPGIKLVFAGITGIDLNKYNRLPYVSKHQWIIDDCILQVNSYLRILNRSDGYYHPRMTSKVHIWKKGRRISRYHLLGDGLHPGPIVIHSWLIALARFHRINTLGLDY